MKKTQRLWNRLITMLSMTVMMILVLGISVSAAGTQKVTLPQISSNSDGSASYQYTGAMEDYFTTVYHKVKIKKPGFIAVFGAAVNESTGQFGSGINVVLCDKKLKPLEAKKGSFVTASESAYYGVNKGTYYLKVTKQKNYVVKLNFAPVHNNGGASKSKAWQLPKQGANYMGILAAGESAGKADWFRFKVTKTKKLELSLQTAFKGTVNFYLYGPGLSSKGSLIRISPNSETQYTIVNKNQKPINAKKGTYYIKVVRNSNSKKASGVYSISWKLTS